MVDAFRLPFQKYMQLFRLEEVKEIRLSDESILTKSRYPLSDDIGNGTLWHEQFAVFFVIPVRVACRLGKAPIASFNPRLHLLTHLPLVLFALKLVLSGKDRLNELTLGAIVKIIV